MYSAGAADDVILRADVLGRPEESVFLLEDGNPNKKQILRGVYPERSRRAQNDTLLSL